MARPARALQERRDMGHDSFVDWPSGRRLRRPFRPVPFERRAPKTLQGRRWPRAGAAGGAVRWRVVGTSSADQVVRLEADADAVIACADNATFLRPIPDASIKLVVTSPPYNLGKSYERRAAMDE